MAKRCYYEVLGVQRTVDEEGLKSAFRKLAMKWHPDRNRGDASSETRFKEINEAYEVLKDPDKRSAYDRFGHAAFEQAAARGSSGFGPGFGSSFSDLFDNIFGMASRAAGASAAADARYDIDMTLEEACAGKTVDLRLPTFASCETCSGSGAKAGTTPKPCSECRGRGRVRFAQGFFSVERTCQSCRGLGRVIEAACQTCLGEGRVKRERSLSVKIPPGVEDGSRIRVVGEGQAGDQGQVGDLYIYLSIAPHSLFERDGADLHCRFPISMVAAALGGEFPVRTIGGGQARLKIPEGTQSGQRFRLPGKGMPILNSRQKGDLYVEVRVETPQNLTSRQRQLLREFDGTFSSQAA